MMSNLPSLCCFILLIALLSSSSFLPTAQALATPSTRRSKASSGRKSNSGFGGGFAKKSTADAPKKHHQQTDTIDYAQIDQIAKSAVSNLFSVCAHIQDPKLYQPKWADACIQQTTSSDGKPSSAAAPPAVIASRNVARGQVLTLFPIHALGLRTLSQNKKKKKNDDDEEDNTKDTEFIAYDQDTDGHLFTPNNANNNQQGAGLRLKLNIPLDKTQPAYPLLGQHTNRHVLFSMFLPEKKVQQGWLGGRMKATSSQHDKVGNCITLPLPGAAPLCAVVATKDIMEGDEIISTAASLKPSVMDELKGLVASQYKRELSTLQMYIEAACETAVQQQQQQSEQLSSDDHNGHQQDDDELLGPFHQLNEQYPGLQRIHSNPDIYAIDNFLTDTECDRLIVKSQPHLVPCLVKNDKNGKVEQDPVRTSTNTNVPQAEVPSIVEKITNVASCNADQLEILQVLNYRRGQEFIPHTDGFSGKFDACGFEQGSRQATIFCYLNDVAAGGCTNFPELGLSIQPKKGMAVIHFPADVNLREDKRTLHQGSPAIDEKWLLTTWVWSKARSDQMYDESKLPPLSSDVI